MKLFKILAFFTVFSSNFLTQSNAIVINIENNSNEPLNVLKSMTIDNDALNSINNYYITDVTIKIKNQYDQLVEQKININKSDSDSDKTNTEINIPKNWTIKQIELICNNISYLFYLNDQQIKIFIVHDTFNQLNL